MAAMTCMTLVMTQKGAAHGHQMKDQHVEDSTSDQGSVVPPLDEKETPKAFVLQYLWSAERGGQSVTHIF